MIGTRPDCISNTIADYLQELSKSKYISVELGIESTNEFTLHKINRCHTFQETIDTVNRLANRNILVGGHLILGFPWESKEEMILHAKKISLLPLKFLKIHHLQIHKFNLLNADEYLELIIEFLENLRSDIVIQRFLTESPKHLLLAPFWDGIKNYEFSSKVEKKLIEKKSWQGKLTNN